MPDEAYQIARRRIINNAKRRNHTSLDLSQKDLVALPPEIGQLRGLKKLDLSGNKLTTLPAEVGLLVQLEELNIAHNAVTDLPTEVWYLPSLAKLNIEKNKLRSLPPTIANLSTLQFLSVGGNPLGQIPPEIGRLRQLKSLSIDRAELKGLPQELSYLTELFFLAIDHNLLQEIPAYIYQFPRLKHLYADSNQFRSISPAIENLSQLESLVLGKNALKSLPSEIAKLQRLTVLDVRDNQLTALPQSFGDLRNLTKAAERDSHPVVDGLRLDGNPLPAPYPALIAQGQPTATANVLAWLRGELDPSGLSPPPAPSEISEKELEGALEQRPASFRFGFRDGKIDTLPERPVAMDADVAIDLRAELLSKARSLEARLAQTNSDARARASVSRLLSEIEKELNQIRPGLLLSRARSIEADRNAFDSEQGRRELFPDAIAMMDDVLLCLQDLLAVFPIVREIEAERLSLAIQGDLSTLDSITANTRVIKETATNSEIVTQEAAEALRENDDQIRDARTIVVQSRLIADQLLIIRNFVGGAALFARHALAPSAKRVALELGELGSESWSEVKANLPAGIGTASRALPLVALIGLLAAISPHVAGIAGAAAAFSPLSRALRKIVGSTTNTDSAKKHSKTKRGSSEKK